MVEKREISGFFLSQEKFDAHIAALSSPDCTTEHVRLFHNEPHHTAALIRALGRNASVTSLDLFELDPGAASALAAFLVGTTRLTSFAVHHMHGGDAAARLASGLAANTSLSQLHFSQLDSSGVTAIAGALAAWGGGACAADGAAPLPPPRLHTLRLDKCAIPAAAAAALAAAVGPQGRALWKLELVECDLGDAAGAELLGSPQWARLGPSLSTLDLSGCHLGPNAAHRLSSFLATSPRLQTLSLSGNKGLGCAGATALAPGVAATRSLHRLDLSGCGVGASGAAALAEALAAAAAAGAGGESPSALNYLALSDNALGAASFLAILRVLSGPTPAGVRTLLLDRCHIRGADLTAALSAAAAGAAPPPTDAAAAVQHLPYVTAPLEQLSLAGNALYDAGVSLLAPALLPAPSLEHLDLRENGLSDGAVTALLPLVAPTRHVPAPLASGAPGPAGGPTQSLQGLAGLLLDGNRLHNTGGQALLDAVAAAPGLWRFSAEANKLTDPALRLSLTQLSQQRAARHSQLVVLGRQYSSSSDDSAGGGRRGSGGGGGDGGGGGADGGGGEGGRGYAANNPSLKSYATFVGGTSFRTRNADSSAAGGGSGPAPMDLDGQPPANGAAANGHHANGHSNGHANGHANGHHKHQLDVGGYGGGGGCPDPDLSQPERNVAARPNSGGGNWGGHDASPHALAAHHHHAAPHVTPCAPYGYGSQHAWRIPGGACGGLSSPSSSIDGGCYDAVACGGGGGSAALSASPPPAMCYITAMTGVNGAGSVGVSKRVSDAIASAADGAAPASASKPPPQQILPTCRRPRYKPLTPEQQRMFEDF
ncbi:hypothetical protein HYH03_016959 [Edaphochlamys debaryana]|uniref:Uncharacterized protein n=1 Tax=Edaphochlamys debaryana TaxID=47281 RepID=A0A836BQY0_9CHLO|nr:hypothetical protein HYH03_016959 [Edaphochlamys debaryana]|eukprot:KAG2484224.1 hypothetical protein HYH03_016959 [Edaphochlamys debaryana]